MPYLLIDGSPLPQSLAIARYLAKKFGFAGKDELEQAKADAIADSICDFQNDWVKAVFFSADKEAAIKKFKEVDSPLHLGRIEKLISLYGSNGFAVGGALTWADLYLYDVARAAVALESTALDKFPGVTGSQKSVEANEKLAAYLASRPETPF